MILIVEPAPKGRFRALLGTRLLVTSRTPLCSSARALLADGADPETELVMTHAGSPFPAMRSTVGEAAGLMISEGGHAPRFVDWRPFREGLDDDDQRAAQESPRRAADASGDRE